jgi:hypothetical protein
MIVSKYFVGGGLWGLLNINLFITSARPLKSIFSLFRLYIYPRGTSNDAPKQQNILIQSLTLYTQLLKMVLVEDCGGTFVYL